MGGEQHISIIVESYRKHFDDDLIGVQNDPEITHKVETAPFPILSHTNAPDPIFNYGNQKALEIFEYSWEEFIKLPSRLSAEVGLQDERARVMREVRENGFTANYKGIRVSKSGRRFEILRAAIWNVEDESGIFIGQAAALFDWINLGS
jgi:hypothetical protein